MVGRNFTLDFDYFRNEQSESIMCPFRSILFFLLISSSGWAQLTVEYSSTLGDTRQDYTRTVLEINDGIILVGMEHEKSASGSLDQINLVIRKVDDAGQVIFEKKHLHQELVGSQANTIYVGPLTYIGALIFEKRLFIAGRTSGHRSQKCTDNKDELLIYTFDLNGNFLHLDSHCSDDFPFSVITSFGNDKIILGGRTKLNAHFRPSILSYDINTTQIEFKVFEEEFGNIVDIKKSNDMLICLAKIDDHVSNNSLKYPKMKNWIFVLDQDLVFTHSQKFKYINDVRPHSFLILNDNDYLIAVSDSYYRIGGYYNIKNEQLEYSAIRKDQVSIKGIFQKNDFTYLIGAKRFGDDTLEIFTYKNGQQISRQPIVDEFQYYHQTSFTLIEDDLYILTESHKDGIVIDKYKTKLHKVNVR